MIKCSFCNISIDKANKMIESDIMKGNYICDVCSRHFKKILSISNKVKNINSDNIIRLNDNNLA